VTANTLRPAFVIAILVVLSWYDLRLRIIPNRIVLPAWALVLALDLLLRPGDWVEWIAASTIAVGLFLLPALVYPSGLGMGDVKLAGLIGATLGYRVFTALLLGTLLAGVFAALLLIHHGSAARKKTFAYGPFLAAGAVVLLLV
jgi:leader peptidase (prepilin peptidase)/N-methyltransferase